jgi:hypothetical protein
VLCVPEPAANADAASPGLGLEARLKAGEAIDFLTPVAINGSIQELRVWRVIR